MPIIIWLLYCKYFVMYFLNRKSFAAFHLVTLYGLYRSYIRAPGFPLALGNLTSYMILCKFLYCRLSVKCDAFVYAYMQIKPYSARFSLLSMFFAFISCFGSFICFSSLPFCNCEYNMFAMDKQITDAIQNLFAGQRGGHIHRHC